MLQISGIFNAPVGKWYGIPTLAFSDTENDIWANKLSFSLSRHVFSPTCFNRQIGGTWKNQIFYPSYHELAYLSPRYFPEVKSENKFLVRFVGWGAGHDIGEKGLAPAQKIEIVSILKQWGEVYISSEAPLPESIAQYACTFHPAEVHNFMKMCKMVVGESATMASEAAILGIPAVFISDTGRGYTTEQDKKYGLIKHYQRQQWSEIIATLKEWAGQDLAAQWQEKRWNMLRDKIEVTDWLVDLVEQYPDSIRVLQKGNFSKNKIRTT
jgi:predicted glycosyltransferase